MCQRLLCIVLQRDSGLFYFYSYIKIYSYVLPPVSSLLQIDFSVQYWRVSNFLKCILRREDT